MKKNYLTYLESTKCSTFKLFLFAAFALLFGVQQASASHLAGGNITYSCASGNTYNVKVTIFRDCIGINLSAPTLIVSGCGSTFNVAYTGPTVNPVLVTQPCNATVKTACDVPPGPAPGIQRFDFNFTYALPAVLQSCTDISFSYDVGARNAAITTLLNGSNQNLRIEAHLNPVIASCNTSPTFPNEANMYHDMFLCLNQQNCFNYGVTETVNNDSLSYSWMTPLQNGGAKVTYFNASFDSAHGITGTATLDPVNGDVCMTPTVSNQVAVIAIKVTEWRRINGVMTKIGWVERDIQLYMINCTNNLPTLTGVDSSAVFTATACPGAPLCFNVYSNDLDAGDSTFISKISGPGTFTVTPGKRASGRFCYQSVPADSSKTYTFVLSVRDNACPQNGSRTVSYTLNFVNMQSTTSSTPVSCFGGSNGTATVNVTGGTPGYSYAWSPTSKKTPSIAGLSAGTYCVVITDANGCSTTACQPVFQPTALTVQITNVVHPNCGLLGSFSIVAGGGGGGYTYSTNTKPAQTGSNVTGLIPGTYTVTVRDNNGCRTSTTVVMPVGSTLTATASHTNILCFGAKNGSACAIPAGSPGPYFYSWSNGATDSCITGLAGGTYSVIVTNQIGCSASAPVTISEPPALVVTETHIDPSQCTCNSTNTLGSIDLTVSGGTGAYKYTWSNTATTQDITGLSGGTYTANVSDGNNCSVPKTVVLTTSAAMVATSTHTDATCASSSDGSASVSVTGGIPPYTYLWSNGATSATATGLKPGYYTVRVTDLLGCKVFVTEVVGYINLCRTSDNGVIHLETSSHGATVVVYPNPTNDLVNIVISGIKTDAMIQADVTDIIGNRIISRTDKAATYFYNGSINMSNLSPGIYMLRIQYEDQVKTVRVVKQ